MGFASGSVSYRRYQVSGPHAESVDKKLIGALRQHAFGPGDRISTDGIETGWVAPTHLFDVDITADKVAVGPYLHLSMRLDRLAAPPAVIRSYRQMEEEAAREASGKPKLSAEDRRQAKDAAQARADKESRQGKFQRISAHPVVFDLENHMLYVGSLGNAVHDKLRVLFSNTFGATLIPLDVGELASQLTQDAGVHRSFEDAVPTHLIEPPTGAGSGSVDASDRTFVGREFLSWLWHELEAEGGMVRLTPDGLHTLPSEVAVAIDKVMQLDCDFQLTGRDVVYADDPGAAPEARAALRIGKQPRRLGLVLAATGEQYTLVLDAPRWQVTGLTLPESEEPNPRVRLEERLSQVARCSAILDALLARYLAVRFGTSFKTDLRKLQHWASNGHNGSARPESRSAKPAALHVVG